MSKEVDKAEPDLQTPGLGQPPRISIRSALTPESILSLLPAFLCSSTSRLWSGDSEMDQRPGLGPREHTTGEKG